MENTIKIVSGSGALLRLHEQISEYSPKLSYIALYGENDEVQRALSAQYYIEKLPTVSTLARLKNITVPGEARTLVVVDESEIGKFIAAKYALNLVLVLTKPCSVNALSAATKLTFCGGISTCVSPSVAVIDDDILSLSEREITGGYGTITASLLSDYETYVDSVVYGKTRAYEGISSLVHAFLSAPITPISIVKTSAALAKIVASAGEYLSYPHGEYARLMRLQNVPLSEGQLQLQCAINVLSTYIAYLRYLPQFALSVPHSAAALDNLQRYCKLSTLATYKTMPTPYDRLTSEKTRYMLASCRDELLTKAIKTLKTLKNCLLTQKRLYKDKGFAYNNALKSECFRRALPLIPYVCSGGLLAKLHASGALSGIK